MFSKDLMRAQIQEGQGRNAYHDIKRKTKDGILLCRKKFQLRII